MKCSDSRKTVHDALLKDVSTLQCQPITASSCWTCYFKRIQKGFVNTGIEIRLFEVFLVWIELIVLVMHLSLKGQVRFHGLFVFSLFRTHFTYDMRKSIDLSDLIKWISFRMWTVSTEDRIWKPNQIYMPCEQSQSTSVQCSFWLFYSVLNSLIRYLNLKVKIMESLDWKNSIPSHMNKTRYCKHKQVALPENDTPR